MSHILIYKYHHHTIMKGKLPSYDTYHGVLSYIIKARFEGRGGLKVKKINV